MAHILNESDNSKLHNLFEKIKTGNTILMLGAGASVTNKKYLSQQIINYYEDSINDNYGIEDITHFIDVLESDDFFDRKVFDEKVAELLKKLTLSDHHKIIASIPWKLILTTNYDLLLENAYDTIRGTENHIHDLYPIRNLKEYNTYTESNNEIRYIKLNGCLADKSKYPFIFSTRDFDSVKKFHSKVTRSFSNPSPKINFISAGYSYSDRFAFKFLKSFDDSGNGNRRWIYNIDPYFDEKLLSYFEKKRIHIIKMSCDDFFKKYQEWEFEHLKANIKLSQKKTIRMGRADSKISPKLQYNLQYAIRQIDNSYDGKFISRKDFYVGEEPNFNVILKNYDVIRNELLDSITNKINCINVEQDLIPIIFLTGSFGTGKSTFTYRLIHRFIENTEMNAIAFEIIDFERLSINDMIQLIESINCSTIILHCNLLEKDSIFKSILNLRTTLSSHQFNNRIYFLLSIRENILALNQKEREIKNSKEFNIDQQLNDEEIDDLIENLGQCGLIQYYRDSNQKKELRKLIKTKHDSDQFISLLDLVTNGQHINDLRDAYDQLSEECQKAFLFTALLHKFKIFMPANILKNLVSKDWEEFQENVIKVEGKGILIQEDVNSKGLDPDLYFKTKHPLIAQKIIKSELNKNKQFSFYKKVFQHITPGEKNVRLAIDLLKSIKKSNLFSSQQLTALYATANINLSNEPYFLLNYAINLQNNRTSKSLKKAYDMLIYAEGLLDKRPHRFIHRRGSIKFDLAKLSFREGGSINTTYRHLRDAKELLKIKQIYDPFTHYSYCDLINAMLWELKNFNLSDDEQLRIRIQIEDLIEIAENTLVDGLNKILEIQNQYFTEIKYYHRDDEYKESLLEKYSKPHLRPLACILLYNYYLTKNDEDKCVEFINEMEDYLDNYEVLVFMFKYYGNRLYNANIRVKYFNLIRNNEVLQEDQNLRFYYYSYVAEAYNWNFQFAFNNLSQIKEKFFHLNPEYQQFWIDEETNQPRIFNGKLVKYKNKWGFKSGLFSRKIPFNSLPKGTLKAGDEIEVKLKFYLYGIRVEAI